jgi:hypothetical protein
MEMKETFNREWMEAVDGWMEGMDGMEMEGME